MTGTNVVQLRKAPASKRTRMDTLLVNQAVIDSWRKPPFQRPLRVNAKVLECVEVIKQDGGVIPGTITLGVIDRGADSGTYLIDGQHRIEAFKMSGLSEGYADCRVIEHEDMASLGDEFVNLNSHLVTLRPDDILRGLEESYPALQTIHEACPFVGYDNIRRSPTNAIVSMSAVLRVWEGSTGDVPGQAHGGAAVIVKSISSQSVETLIDFLKIAMDAWGREPDSFRLWGNLNLSLCMWLYRQLVLMERPGIKKGQARSVTLKPDEFKRCLMAVGADSDYSDWLLGRHLGDRDRSPAYARVKRAFQKRLKAEGKDNIKLPSPAWAHHMGGQRGFTIGE